MKLARIDGSYVELYDRLGGAPVLERALTAFHAAVTRDPQLKPLLEGYDTAQLLPLGISFFTMIFGGPNTYDGLDMRRAHAPLRARGLDDSHLEIGVAHFREALAAQGLAPALVSEAESYLQAMRDDILGL